MKATIKIQLEKPVCQKFLTDNQSKITREDATSVFLTEQCRNRYRGDDETIVFDLGHSLLRNYQGEYRILWDESDF